MELTQHYYQLSQHIQPSYHALAGPWPNIDNMPMIKITLSRLQALRKHQSTQDQPHPKMPSQRIGMERKDNSKPCQLCLITLIL